MPEESKQCSRCNQELPLEQFYRHKGKPQGRRSMCIKCLTVVTAPHRDGSIHPHLRLLRRKARLRNKLGISYEEFEQATIHRAGTCGICGIIETEYNKLVPDHDHSTKLLRDALCGKCNKGIGAALDNMDILKSGAGYIDRWREILDPSWRDIEISLGNLAEPPGGFTEVPTIKESMAYALAQGPYHGKDREATYLRHLRRKYGLTEEAYLSMLQHQLGRCAICTRVPQRRLCVDHSASLDKVRSLLCDHCNRMLGFFRDQSWLLRSAASYVGHHRRKHAVILATSNPKETAGS